MASGLGSSSLKAERVDDDSRDCPRLKAARVDQAVEQDGQRVRLRQLLADGTLVHPLSPGTLSFADLAHALSLCCGLGPEIPVRLPQAQQLAGEIGGSNRRHVVVVLCDGMGGNVLNKHLAREGSFIHKHNDPNRLLAIFPSTTPAALTTLATAAWPGQHGLPGWDLRDQKCCEFPGVAGPGHVQIRVLHDFVVDRRSNKPASDFGFTEARDVYVRAPWASTGKTERRMSIVNAYRSDFTRWFNNDGCHKDIQETASDTLGKPEGSACAVQYFHDGVDAVLETIADADRVGEKTYTYVYTAHPDKHMHALGVEHAEVGAVVRGIDAELARLWSRLEGLDAALVVTADHGHITVEPSEMITLPDDVLECLEYANIGLHGPGRHACLHCRSGRHQELEARWASHAALRDHFLLLPVDVVAEERLFGPEVPVPAVRPRLGDYLSIPIDTHTLAKPAEAERWRDGPLAGCQGAHGSLTPEEMHIPFVLCVPSSPVSPGMSLPESAVQARKKLVS